ncbi:hypothetical protein [Helicobacter suis]|uniref:hypothetical protein n=1 Tax=Helicobacter suis TaxID=104628 RepID=UPI0013D2E832|nr:hypothetical protein [Helicobacter suis]
MQGTHQRYEEIHDYYRLGAEQYAHHPRITRAAYNPYHHRTAEIKKVEAYIRKEMADFEIKKKNFTFEEKHRLLTYSP